MGTETPPGVGDERPSRPARRGAGIDLAWAGIFALVAGLLQLLATVPWDADTAYHVAVSRLIARHGILHSFPWTAFSWLADHYADKELAFHLLMVPLAGLPWMTAAKIAGALLGGALLFTLYLVLRAEGVRYPGLWALLPLASSGAFILRFALVRPHLLSISLALVAAWAAARRRSAPLAAAALLYPWCYVAWHTPLVLVAIAEVAQLLGGRRPEWKPAAVVGGALLLGLVLHPNFPEIVRFARIVNVDVLVRTAWAGKEGFALGQEFEPFSPDRTFRFLALPLAFAVVAAVAAWRRRHEDPGGLALALMACAYGFLALRTSRFVEYLAPFSVLALAVALRRSRAAAGAPLVMAGSLAFTALFGASSLRWLESRGDDLPPALAALLQKAIPEGAQVYTCDWGLTGELLLALPERKFMVALDPTLFALEDPERYRLWYALSRRGPPDSAEQIRRRFGARYVLCAMVPEWGPLRAALERDPTVRQLIHTPLWFYADLGAVTVGGP